MPAPLHACPLRPTPLSGILAPDLLRHLPHRRQFWNDGPHLCRDACQRWSIAKAARLAGIARQLEGCAERHQLDPFGDGCLIYQAAWDAHEISRDMMRHLQDGEPQQAEMHYTRRLRPCGRRIRYGDALTLAMAGQWNQPCGSCRAFAMLGGGRLATGVLSGVPHGRTWCAECR